MIAINGPFQGKYYSDRVTAKKLVDHAGVGIHIIECTYYRTKIGWAFHSWKKIN